MLEIQQIYYVEVKILKVNYFFLFFTYGWRSFHVVMYDNNCRVIYGMYICQAGFKVVFCECLQIVM